LLKTFPFFKFIMPSNFTQSVQLETTAVGINSWAHYLLEGYWTENGDPRVVPYFLMSSMRPLLTVLLAYSAFVLFFGPRYMQNRKPYSLKPLLIVYNLVMSLWNAYFFYRVVVVDYNWGLAMFDVRFPSFDDTSLAVLSKLQVADMYLISKLIDLCDTIFFVLRKKQKQVTWLHFYHHFSVPLFGWIHFRLCGTNAVVIPFGLMNSFIHTLMYAYYGLSALGPQLQPYLWWKRYLTQIQIAQFVLLFAYAIYFSCFQVGYSVFFSVNTIIQSVMYTWLFSRFYFATYRSNKKAVVAASKQEAIKSEMSQQLLVETSAKKEL